MDLSLEGDLATPDDAGGVAADLSSPGPTQLAVLAGGTGGPGNADDSGNGARLNDPFGITSDGAGNLYFVDTFNHTVRKIVISTGAVTTLAGQSGQSGVADGTGATARFNTPHGVAADGGGNLFIADTNNHVIRQVVISTGVVTTLAGSAGLAGGVDGTGSAARFRSPYDVATDGNGNLLVADTFNHTIRRVTISGGVVSTLAGAAGSSGATNGTGSGARFSSPAGVVADGSGNAFVADNGNEIIRKIVLATATVSTFAGGVVSVGATDGIGTAARFTSPSSVAVDGAGNLLVGDSGNHLIRSIVLSSAAVTTLAGLAGNSGSSDGTGSAARFNGPHGLVSDRAGTLYVTDSGNFAIRRIVQATAAVTTAVGMPYAFGTTNATGAAARFRNPFAVAADASGNLYVADTNNSAVRKIVISTGVVTTLAGTAGMSGNADGIGAAARFGFPYGLTWDGGGNLYVADTGSHTIRRVALSNGAVTTIAGQAGVAGNTDAAGTLARFNFPYGIAADGAGALYVADTRNHTIRKLVIAGFGVSTLAGTSGSAGNADGQGSAARFDTPYGLACDGTGSVYVADSNNHILRKVVISTGTVTTLAGSPGQAGSSDGNGSAARFDTPYKLATDGLGNLIIADWGNATVRKLKISSGDVSTLIGVAGRRGIKPGPLPARLNRPAAVTAAPGGQIFVVDQEESTVLSTL